MPQTIFGEGNGMVGADNGRVIRTAATYAGLSSASNSWIFSDIYNYTERYFSAGTYGVTVGLYRWDTSSLPDTAVITGATFRSDLLAAGSADALNFVLGWVTWDGTSATDWSATATNDAHAGTSVASLLAGGAGDKDFILTGYDTGINKTGYTYLKAWISGTTPTGANNANYAAVDNTTNQGPRLIVDYTTDPPVRIAPDAIISATNLSGTVAAIQDDPDSPDANWLTAP